MFQRAVNVSYMIFSHGQYFLESVQTRVEDALDLSDFGVAHAMSDSVMCDLRNATRFCATVRADSRAMPVNVVKTAIPCSRRSTESPQPWIMPIGEAGDSVDVANSPDVLMSGQSISSPSSDRRRCDARTRNGLALEVDCWSVDDPSIEIEDPLPRCARHLARRR